MDIFNYPMNFKMFRRVIRVALAYGWEQIKERPWPMVLIGIFALVVAWYVDIVSALLWMIFLMFLVYRWESRILGAAAIVLLVVCPLLISLNLEPYAELIAVYAFFFLVMTVVLQIVEMKRGAKNDEK